MVDPAPAEHRRLAIGLGVAVDLEDVELGVRADVDDRQVHRTRLGIGRAQVDDRLEDLLVEAVEPRRIVGQRGDVVEAVEQHGLSLS